MAIQIEERLPKELDSSKVKNAFAAWVMNPIGSVDMRNDGTTLILSGKDEPDKMDLPTSYSDRLALVRYFYERDPIASTAINKFIDVGINKLVIDREECTDEELEIYEHIVERLIPFIKDAMLEYLISGLVIPQVAWQAFTPAELDMEANKQFQLPGDVWLLDPALIRLEFRPLSTAVNAFIKIPESIRKLLSSKAAGNQAIITKLARQFPNFVNAVKKGKTEIQLPEDTFILRRRAKTYDPYPTPYLLSALESLLFKRNLKKMDYAIASRVIGAIQVIRLGNDTFPLTEDDDDQLTDLKNQMLWREKQKNIDRVFQLFANHTLEIEWVYPDTEAMLNQDKYVAVNDDIYNALGIPRILVSGETLRSATSQAEYALFSPAETIKRAREEILTFIKKLLKEIKVRNNFSDTVCVSFEELRLYDLGKLAEIAVSLYEKNALSLSSLAAIAGYNFMDELEKKSNEREVMKELDVPEFPALPFSPQPGVPGQRTNQQQDQGGE